MAKFGKLELTDDSDEDTEEVRVVTKRKRAVETIIISSDEEEGDNSSDLSSLPPSPAPVRRPVLKGKNNGSREQKTAERAQATEDLLGSTSGSPLSGTSSGDDGDVTVRYIPRLTACLCEHYTYFCPPTRFWKQHLRNLRRFGEHRNRHSKQIEQKKIQTTTVYMKSRSRLKPVSLACRNFDLAYLMSVS